MNSTELNTQAFPNAEPTSQPMRKIVGKPKQWPPKKRIGRKFNRGFIGLGGKP